MKNFKILIAVVAVLLVATANARAISADSIYCNDGTTVSVPVLIDDVSDAALIMLTVNYDSTIVVFQGAVAGDVTDKSEFFYASDDSGRLLAVAPKLVKDSGGGVICYLKFHVRQGTSGQFSDIAIASAQVCASDGVRDLSVTNPIQIKQGMIKVHSSIADVARLEEVFVLWGASEVGHVTLAAGDRIKAADNKKPIKTQSVNASGTIPVEAPPNGWQTGSYALLSTTTPGLVFAISDADSVSYRSEVESGITTYYANIVMEGQVVVNFDDEDISSEVAGQIRTLLEETLAENPAVTHLAVRGDKEVVSVSADLGIAPQVDITGTEMTATYKPPKLSIVAFDPDTGVVRIKVIPGEGNSIRTVLATGCIHVYGTSNLGEKMRHISGVQFDLAPYLQEGTKGEADLTVSLGSHTFLKVKASATYTEIEE